MAKGTTRRHLIGRQQQSGLSICAFCDAEGVSQPSFFSWRKRLRSQQRQTKPQFVPVEIAMPDALTSAGHIEIVLAGGRRVRVAPGFDEQALKSVLAILEQPSC